jgi:hypothetical protein
MDNILISSSNRGGLFLYREEQVYEIDRYATTGLSVRNKEMLRAFHPRQLVLYGDGLGRALGLGDSAEYDDVHDVLLMDGFVYLVDTAGNSIIKLDESGKEIDKWSFEGESDSWHINCLISWNGRLLFSAFGQFSQHREYKGKTSKAGFVQDLHSKERLLTGLSQPHSLTRYGDNLLLANSECKEVIEVDSRFDIVRRVGFDGYTRGICVGENHIYVGLSRSRNIDNAKSSDAELVVLSKDCWRELGRIPLPVEEVYCLLRVENDGLLNMLPALADFSARKSWESISKHETTIREQLMCISEQSARMAEQSARMAALEGQLHAILNSKSWLITRPLRWVRRGLRG